MANVVAGLIVVALVVCLSTSCFGRYKKSSVIIPIGEQNIPIEVPTDTDYIPNVIVSQDHWDSDNPTMVYIACKLHREGKINLLAVVVSGTDVDNKAGIIMSAITDDNIPLIVDVHNDTRVTPTSRRFPNIAKYTKETMEDTKWSNVKGVDYLASIIEKSSGKIIYASGGHINTLARLLENYNSLVARKFDRVSIGSGWTDRTSGVPEMNLSEGVKKQTGTSRNTNKVFDLMPNNVKIVMASVPNLDLGVFPMSIIHAPALKYLIENGTYHKGNVFKAGDFLALVYAVYGTVRYNKEIFKEVRTSYVVTSYGAVKIGNSGKTNHYYIEPTVSSTYFKQLFIELIQRRD